MITKHTKPFILNLANVRIIYSTPEWRGCDQYFMQEIENARGQGAGNFRPAQYYFTVSAPDYDPSKADPEITPGRDLAHQYAVNYQWDQHQAFIYHTKKRHSRRISIRVASKRDLGRYPKLSQLIKRAAH